MLLSATDRLACPLQVSPGVDMRGKSVSGVGWEESRGSSNGGLYLRLGFFAADPDRDYWHEMAVQSSCAVQQRPG